MRIRNIQELRQELAQGLLPIPAKKTLDICRDVGLQPSLGMAYLESHLAKEEMKKLRNQYKMEHFFRRRSYRDRLLNPAEFELLSSGRWVTARNKRIADEQAQLGIPEGEKDAWVKSLHDYDFQESDLSYVCLEDIVMSDIYLYRMKIENSTLLGDLRSSSWHRVSAENSTIGKLNSSSFHCSKFKGCSLSIAHQNTIYDHLSLEECSLEFDEANLNVFDVQEDEPNRLLELRDCTVRGYLTISVDDQVNRENFEIKLDRVRLEKGAVIFVQGYDISTSEDTDGYRSVRFVAANDETTTILSEEVSNETKN